MYVVVQHQIRNVQTAFARGEKLMKSEGAPAGVRNLQFYPSRDRSFVTCLWEAPSVAAVQGYVDSTLGNSSENTCYEVDSEQAFARQPLGLRESAAVGGQRLDVESVPILGTFSQQASDAPLDGFAFGAQVTGASSRI